MRISINLATLLAIACWAFPGSVTSAQEDKALTIYGGPADGESWMTNGRRAVPAANLSEEGLNPHGSGGYLVVYKEPMRNFVLDFDYKLSKGCNSGVFVRVGDLDDPVMTGLEIALDDTQGAGFHDSGAIYDLVKPAKNAQKPAGEWNHMTIEAKGPVITVTLNGEVVTRIDQSKWTEPGKRPDGSNHKFSGVTIKTLDQEGYFGFQDHGQDCWFRNVTVRELD